MTSADAAVLPELAPPWLRPLVRALGDSAAGEGDEPEADSAVLIVFTGDPRATRVPDDAAVLLTHRHPNMRSHSGQMAFPGGHIDPTDAGPVDAALREAWEETGLQRDRVVPLAVLEAANTRGSRRRVRPVVAYAASPGPVGPASEEETDDVFFTPLAHLLRPANRLRVRWRGWTGPAFWVGCYLVWGFTGAVLATLLEKAGWEEPYASEVRELADALEQSCNGEDHAGAAARGR